VVLATAMIEEPMVKLWVRSAAPYTPFAPSTPARWPWKLTVVLAGQ
jgi:hypothetical protein